MRKEYKKTPVSDWLEEILKRAIIQRASDIHLEVERDDLVVRFRIDGVMQVIARREKFEHELIISRLKVISRLSITDSNIPQDGHLEIPIELPKEFAGFIRLSDGNRGMASFRVSIMPTIYGEAAVLRVLNRQENVLRLEALGFSETSLAAVKDILHHPHGMILVTGPTASGKTTTLYSILQTYNVQEKVVLTLEDPVEYQLPYIRQTQVAPQVGLTFAAGLKAILRQDPDIIMIGEIRDEETGEIAIRAALAGRLVFSTLHTNNVAGAIVRLIDMNISRSMIAAALEGIIAGRLVRKICGHCKEEVPVPQDLLKFLQVDKWHGGEVFAGRGCIHCKGTGFFGRLGIFEVLSVDQEIKNLILQDATPDEINDAVRIKVTETLKEDGLNKVKLGITTLEEVVKVVAE